MNFSEARQLAADVAAQYEALNKAHRRPTWETLDYMNGFVADVGDLSKLLSAKLGKRPGPVDLDHALQHELADCLWSVLILAENLQIDLADVFQREMRALATKLRTAIVQNASQEQEAPQPGPSLCDQFPSGLANSTTDDGQNQHRPL